MNIRLKIFVIFAIVIFFITIYKQYAKNKLSFNELMSWTLFSLACVLVVVYYDSILSFVNWLGIIELSNLIYFILFGLILKKIISMNSVIHHQEEKIRFLIQESGIKNAKKDI